MFDNLDRLFGGEATMGRPSGDWTRSVPVDSHIVTWDSRPGIGVLVVGYSLFLPVFLHGLGFETINGAERVIEGRTILAFSNEDAAWDCAVQAQQQHDRDTAG